MYKRQGHAALPQETKSNLRAAFDYHMPARFAAPVSYTHLDVYKRQDNELDDQTAKLISRLLSEDAKVRAEVIAEWQVTANAQPVHESKQTILVSNRLFAQGYAPFVPYLGALRFDFDGKQWQTQANIADNTFNPNIWRHLPANAAFCVATPIDWAQVQTCLLYTSSPPLKHNCSNLPILVIRYCPMKIM